MSDWEEYIDDDKNIDIKKEGETFEDEIIKKEEEKKPEPKPE